MDSTSSNGGVRARSRKATTSPVQPPNGASVERQTVPADGASDARPNANVTQRRPTQAVAESRPLPPETYAAIAIEAVEPELDEDTANEPEVWANTSVAPAPAKKPHSGGKAA